MAIPLEPRSGPSGNIKTHPKPQPNLDQVDLDMYFFRDGKMAKGQKGMLTVPTENWTAEIFSPPYRFIDETREPNIQSIQAEEPLETPYQMRTEIEGKSYYLLHSNFTYHVHLRDLPQQCPVDQGSLVLMKLPSVTHGWDSGQKIIELPYHMHNNANTIRFRTPNAQAANIPLAYYMMFYVDCHGKPSQAQMVRFDDSVNQI